MPRPFPTDLRLVIGQPLTATSSDHWATLISLRWSTKEPVGVNATMIIFDALWVYRVGQGSWGRGDILILDFPILIYKCEVKEGKGGGRKQSWKETEKSKSFHTFITAKGEQVDTYIERIRERSSAA